MSHNAIKKMFAILALAFACFGGIQFSTINNVYAAPFVKLDYGETRGRLHVFWLVDKGSLDSRDTYTSITVELEDGYSVVEHWIYKFFETKNGWVYTRTGYTGKGTPIKTHEKATGELVANNRLANDILYIALH